MNARQLPVKVPEPATTKQRDAPTLPGPGLSSLSGRPLAAVLLGWSLLRVLIKRAFGRTVRGYAVFQQNYRSDGLNAVQAKDRQRLPRFGACIACGRCDLGEGGRIAQSGGQYPGLMQLVLASTRNMPDYDAARRGFDHVPTEVLRQKEPQCPADIPFVELASFVRRQAVDGDGRGVR